MKFFPIFIDLHDRECQVIGGGSIALRKVRLLTSAGARVTVIAPEICSDIRALAKDTAMTLIESAFSENLVGQPYLIVAATNNESVNVSIASACNRRNILVNVVDRPSLCSFIMPAIIDRSPVVIAVSSGGSSPVLSRLLRGRLESFVPHSYGKLAILAEKYRAKVKALIPAERRRVFWENMLQGPVAELTLSGQDDKAIELLERSLQDEQRHDHEVGEVYLVGAGPGDPDLLTFRALRLMQQADVVVYDRLVSEAVLNLVRRDADRIYAGKERSNHALPQEDINQLLARLAKEGKRVLRLKGGDPFIFGRGGEEIETLAAQGINFQVVPGITAASGCASYAGIPLTHRDHAQSCLFVTGHLKDGKPHFDWHALVRPKQTLVVYMGLHHLRFICEALIEHGLDASMPMAIISHGTQPSQRTLVSTVGNMPNEPELDQIKAPTLLIIGEVVTLQDKLQWFKPDLVSL